ncbi:hypothetical protein ACU4GD_11240 [Cupriavidus basilensis]
MQKLSILTLGLLAALACMTVFICLSGAFTSRDTEYGSGTAVFCYIDGAASLRHAARAHLSGTARSLT